MRQPTEWVYSESRSYADAFHQEAAEMRQLLWAPKRDRTIGWLRRMLQWAIQLEFSTIPPYLTALWSIRDPQSPVRYFLGQIVKQEMLHMGIMCNLLKAIGGTPVIASSATVPRYPRVGLPGGVLPHLRLGLERISKELVVNTLMEIEKPTAGPLFLHKGEAFPTIGLFYAAIIRRMRKLRPNQITGAGQIDYVKDEFKLTPVATASAAIAELLRVTEQGEGTATSPKYGPLDDEVAHYFRFGEIYHQSFLKEVAPRRWCYCGENLPFPNDEDIYPMAPIPPEGYALSADFDRKYTEMLRELQLAWDHGGATGKDHLVRSFIHMRDLSPLAVALLEQEITPGGDRYGPAFQFVP